MAVYSNKSLPFSWRHCGHKYRTSRKTGMKLNNTNCLYQYLLLSLFRKRSSRLALLPLHVSNCFSYCICHINHDTVKMVSLLRPAVLCAHYLASFIHNVAFRIFEWRHFRCVEYKLKYNMKYIY